MTVPRVICLDFDGVLHSYTHGWTGTRPTDLPTPGAVMFTRWLLQRGYQVVVQSTRARLTDGHQAILDWLKHYGFPYAIGVVTEKPAACLYVDDRAWRFDPNAAAGFGELAEYLKARPEPGSWCDAVVEKPEEEKQ